MILGTCVVRPGQVYLITELLRGGALLEAVLEKVRFMRRTHPVKPACGQLAGCSNALLPASASERPASCRMPSTGTLQ